MVSMVKGANVVAQVNAKIMSVKETAVIVTNVIHSVMGGNADLIVQIAMREFVIKIMVHV